MIVWELWLLYLHQQQFVSWYCMSYFITLFVLQCDCTSNLMEQLAINIHWTVVNQGHIPLGLFSWFLFWYKNNRTYRISLPKRTDFVLFWKQNKPNQFCSYFAGELQLHLQSMVNLLRDEDVLRLVGYAEFKKILILWLLGVYGIDKDKLFEQFNMYTI